VLVCEGWRVERWRERISWDFLVCDIARCGMEGADEVGGVAEVDCLLFALSK
jgi:hypothetical protein